MYVRTYVYVHACTYVYVYTTSYCAKSILCVRIACIQFVIVTIFFIPLALHFVMSSAGYNNNSINSFSINM